MRNDAGYFTGGSWRTILLFAFYAGFITFSVFSQQKQTITAGVLIEANGNTYHGYGLAGGVSLDYGFTDSIAAGIKADFGSDFYAVSSLEAQAFGRFYFHIIPTPFPLFAQAGAGLVYLFDGEKKVPSVLGDGAIGIRFPVKNFYTEQYVRFGWPHGIGFGLAIGYRFNLKRAPVTLELPQEKEAEEGIKPAEKEAETAEETRPAEEEAETAEPVNIDYLESLEIIFPPNQVAFETAEGNWLYILEENIAAVNLIARFLMERPEYSVSLLGRANPVERTRAEERERLLPISRRRAEYVKNRLIDLGVEAERISVSGAGGQGADSENLTRNRRVEFKFSLNQGHN
jgi:outer membrane protein OmpA-like peptidoglycan-associated protein